MSMKKVLLYGVLPLAVVVGAAGYHRAKRNKELDHQKAVKTVGETTVTLAQVEERSFRNALAFTGTLLAAKRAELRAEVMGRVTRVVPHEGDRVAAGALLCAQDEDDLRLSIQAAEAQLSQAQAQAQQARRDFDRAQMLLEKRSITKQSAQQAETLLNATGASVRAAESNLGLARSRFKKARLVAPFAGEVATRAVQPGEILNPGQTAFVLVDNRQMEILADLPTENISAIQVGMTAAFRVTGFDQRFQARITQVSPALQAEGRTLRVRMEVPNPDGKLKGGLFAEGEILSDKEIRRPALPAHVLTAMGKTADVYVNDQGVARRKRISVGATHEGWRAVEGLKAGDSIVASGWDQVSEGGRLKVAGQSTGEGK